MIHVEHNSSLTFCGIVDFEIAIICFNKSMTITAILIAKSKHVKIN